MGKPQKQYPKHALVRLTNEEHLCLIELAMKAELSFSRFLVESGLSGKAPTNEERMLRERTILQLARVGNNLNQIARQLIGTATPAADERWIWESEMRESAPTRLGTSSRVVKSRLPGLVL